MPFLRRKPIVVVISIGAESPIRRIVVSNRRHHAVQETEPVVGIWWQTVG
jgi:hypothetical protein